MSQTYYGRTAAFDVFAIRGIYSAIRRMQWRCLNEVHSVIDVSGITAHFAVDSSTTRVYVHFVTWSCCRETEFYPNALVGSQAISEVSILFAINHIIFTTLHMNQMSGVLYFHTAPGRFR